MSILLCKQCQRQRILGRSERIALLRAEGKLLRDKDPSPDIVAALFQELLMRLPCDRCGTVMLAEVEENEEFNAEDWGEPRLCIGCGQSIPAERLEILPNTQQCTPCAKAGKTSREDQREFCIRCGGLVSVVPRKGSGLAGYSRICSSCGKSH